MYPESDLIPPQFLKKPVSADSGVVDYLSSDAFRTMSSHGKSGSSRLPGQNNSPGYSPSSPPNVGSMESPPVYTGQLVYDDAVIPSSQPADRLPLAPWDSPAIPPPPARYNQRQQFFKQHQGTPNSSSGRSGSSYDGLEGQTQKLSLNSSAQSKQANQEDALFKDLVDFAKAKSSSSSSLSAKPNPNPNSNPNRSF